MGPANPLWAESTGYAASMVGFPYDDLEHWRGAFPVEVFIGQFETMARGFNQSLVSLKKSLAGRVLEAEQAAALAREMDVAQACAIHFQSVANQARFVQMRQALAQAKTTQQAQEPLEVLEQVLKSEMHLAIQLHGIQQRDSRIGFEGSNHYFYVPADLVAKVINCRYLLTHWLGREHAKRRGQP
jgi:hypothetical protein